MGAQEKHGRRWNIISGYLTGRPAVHCRNRWLSLLRAGRITDRIQQAAETFDTRTLRPVVPGSQNGYSISPAPSPTPSHSSGFDSSLEPLFNGWENQTTPSSQSSAEHYPEGLLAYFGAEAVDSRGHHRSESASSTLSWGSSYSSTDFGIGSLLDQVAYNQGTTSPEVIATTIPSISGTGSPRQLDSLQFTPPPESRSESLTMTCSLQFTPPPESRSESLTMTCSLPYCTFQSTSLTDIWRHMTWDHIGNKAHCPPEMSALVEKVVIGSGSMNQ